MIIGKIMMIQNSSSKESVEYLISKKIMELKGNIKDYTLNRFIEEVGVSKTSMVRYLKNININKFSYFKNVMYEEYMHAEVDFVSKTTSWNFASQQPNNLPVAVKRPIRSLFFGTKIFPLFTELNKTVLSNIFISTWKSNNKFKSVGDP